MSTPSYRARLARLLRGVQAGQIPVSAALDHLRDLPFADLTHAKVDHHRALRRGFPEVIYGQGKTVGQVVAVARRLAAHGHPLVVTKASAAMFARLQRERPGLRYDPVARLITSPWPRPEGGGTASSRRSHRPRGRATVAVVTAGTTDIPVAAEAEAILRLMGRRVDAIYDVGVAGIHRVLAHLPRLRRARAIIVIAGMEGALASVVSGLVARPVIAVPTSVGYGAAFQGLAPLLTMLNSCSPGVTVVNIDNGFGAGYFAALISG